MVYNQNAIALDATTIMVKAAYSMGDAGTVIAQYGSTAGGEANLQGNGVDDQTYGELDLMYKVKAGGVQYFAAYLNRTIDNGGNMLHATNGATAEMEHRVRLWGRLNF